MSFARHLKTKVTHWPVNGSDGFGGFTFGTPVCLSGRWEKKQELFTDFDNEQVISDAIVYLNTDIDVGDYLAEGDLTATSDPTTIDGPFRVRNFGKITDLRNVRALRKVWL